MQNKKEILRKIENIKTAMKEYGSETYKKKISKLHGKRKVTMERSEYIVFENQTYLRGYFDALKWIIGVEKEPEIPKTE